MNPWVSAALGLIAGALLHHRPRRFRRTYQALYCRAHGLFNPGTVPFCPICEGPLEAITLFRRRSIKRAVRRISRRNPAHGGRK